MDLRTQRTETNIRNAFIELRSRRPIEKITVKELAELAYINKATFYQHYRDIYDLSESMEAELIDSIFSSIPHPDTLTEEPRRATLELFQAFRTQTSLLDIIFSGSRRGVLITRLEGRIRDATLQKYPEYENDLEKEVLLTFLIQGAFHAYLKHADRDPQEAVRIIADYVGRAAAT